MDSDIEYKTDDEESVYSEQDYEVENESELEDNDEEDNDAEEEDIDDKDDESEKEESDDELEDININQSYYDSQEFLDSLYKNIETEIMDKIKQQKNNEEATERITQRFLTKYEKTRILGVRATQLAQGAKPLVELEPNHNYTQKEIAELELINKVSPFKIKRPLPNGKYEIWDVNELNLV